MAFAKDQEAKGCRPMIVDAGANIGTASLYFATNMPSAAIIAVEPDSDNFHLLSLNVDGLNVTPIHAAVSSTTGRTRVVDPGLGHWGYRTEHPSPDECGETGMVPRITMNQIFQDFGDSSFPLIVKIDIEGAERDLFSANTEWVTRTPLIIIELHDWMVPKQRTSAPFLRCVAELDRDFVTAGNNVFSIANQLAS
jgi:FkbM family methyltransferase